VCFAALGAGNGALFQLVPLRWPLATAVAGSMIGEIGALGGGLVPNAMGLSKQYAGTYIWGFFLFGVLALVMLGVMRVMQIRWTRTWAEKGGGAHLACSGDAAGTPRRAREAYETALPLSSARQEQQPVDEQRVEQQRDAERDLVDIDRVARISGVAPGAARGARRRAPGPAATPRRFRSAARGSRCHGLQQHQVVQPHRHLGPQARRALRGHAGSAPAGRARSRHKAGGR
jgi:hypothetical protein